MNRRAFLTRAGRAAAAAAAAPSLGSLVACGLDPGTAPGMRAKPYGSLRPAGPELALPEGFRYRAFGREGEVMSDGIATPRAHDGMAAFARPGDGVRLVRNHEDRSGPGEARPLGDPALRYDPDAGGGVTALDLEWTEDGPRLVRDFLLLGGTIVNCAGGPTPWGSWLTCEETTQGPLRGWRREHGYVFEVPALADGQVEAVPIPALGRFVHEAAAVDPETGIVYLTEDRRRSGFYRFLPDRPGEMAAGGRLEMLAVAGDPRLDTRTGMEAGTTLPVEWVEIPDPDPADAESDPGQVARQGRSRGGAAFSHLEGCWYGEGRIYFHATDGGDAGRGQVWAHRPAGDGSGGTLTLVFESPGARVLDGPDNITVSPRGGVLMCEDGGGTDFLRGLTPDGRVYDFAENLLNDREFAGATFDPDGRALFVNIQGDMRPGGPGDPGLTLAIWGPWEEGPL